MEQIEGRHPVREALVAGRPIRRLLVATTAADAPGMREILRLARDRHITVQRVEAGRLDQMARTGRHQGVIALAAARETVTLDVVLAGARARGEAPLVVVLDGVEDPHNLGAVLRVADGAGAHGVIVRSHRAAGLTAAAGRASAGAIEHVPVAQVTNLSRAIDELKREGVWVCGADMAGENLFQVPLAPPLAVVIGGEGRGLSRLVRERCDRLVRIPLFGRVASLNASTAAAVVLFEIRRQAQEAR